MLFTRRFFLSGLVAVSVFTASSVLAAKEPVYTSSSSNLAVSGYDPVAYFRENIAVLGKKQFQTSWKGTTWRFASAANREAFRSNPESFSPQYGGYCAWAVSRGYTASADPEAWHIDNGKLYLNYSKNVQKRWKQDVPGNIAKGDANWPLVSGK
jgi:YHS domain-containing protein